MKWKHKNYSFYFSYMQKNKMDPSNVEKMTWHRNSLLTLEHRQVKSIREKNNNDIVSLSLGNYSSDMVHFPYWLINSFDMKAKSMMVHFVWFLYFNMISSFSVTRTTILISKLVLFPLQKNKLFRIYVETQVLLTFKWIYREQ